MQRSSRARPLAGLLALAVGLAGCGAADANPLSEAERALAGLDAGRIDLTLAATATGDGSRTGPVGFRMQGPFRLEAGSRYPTLDLRYTSLLGADERVVAVVSDGNAVRITHDGVTTEVPVEEAGLLRLGDGEGGFTDLGIAGWVEDPTIVERPDGTTTVTGAVDVADLLSDLGRVSGQAGGGNGAGALDGGGAERLQRLIRHSEFSAELDRGGLPRHLRAVVEFGRDVPAELRPALGPYASPRLEVTLAVEPAAP